MKKIKFRKRHEEYDLGGFTEWYLAYGTRCYILRVTDEELKYGRYIRCSLAKTLWQIRKELRQMPEYTCYIGPL
jgi:hypothetical protein